MYLLSWRDKYRIVSWRKRQTKSKKEEKPTAKLYIKRDSKSNSKTQNMLSSTREVYYRLIWWGDSTLGKAVTCTVSSCIGQNHRPSNCTNNYLRPKWAVSPAVINWHAAARPRQPSKHISSYLKCDNFNVKCTTNMPPCLLPHCCCYYFWPCETSYYIKKKTSILLHYQAKTTKKTNTCASTYHRFCWNCRPQCLQHVCTWSDPRHTFYCRESSWVCKQTTIWTFKITPLSVKKHTKNISVKLSIVLFILSVYVLH